MTDVEEALHRELRAGCARKDFKRVETAFNRYGAYLELVEEPSPVIRAPQLFVWPRETGRIAAEGER